ncbi:transcriptional regulator [Tolypothrix bouteillei VB521301_2]|uniref:transcriptional regulator n=1 Tax=Tolypothrix bouteillei TaxID=1246981 RepID=UPI0038B68F24
MNTLETPQPENSLACYIKRINVLNNNMTQCDVATRAGIHLHSLGKIERGITQSLNTKTRRGLSIALSIPEEYLESVCKGETVETTTHISFCPQCWQPGTPTDPIWNDPRAKFCFICGTALRSPSCSTVVILLHPLSTYYSAQYVASPIKILNSIYV